jgi:hypothetical protein
MGLDQHRAGQPQHGRVVGKMPTTFVLRLTLLTRSKGLVLQILIQCGVGKEAKVRSTRASASMTATAGTWGRGSGCRCSRSRLPSTGTSGARWRSARSACRTWAASTAAPDCCRSCPSDRAHWEWLDGGPLRQFAVAAAALGLMWANMLRPFQLGKARTSHEGPWSWIRESRVASAQESCPACHFTNASASAVM